MFLNDEWTVHSFFLFFFYLYSLQKVRGTQNTGTPGSNILVRFDPRPAGVHVGGGVGGATMFQHKSIFVHPPCLNQSECYAGTVVSREGRVWSVTLVADWRELVLVIQADRALSELVFWDDLTLLGSTILRVTHESGRGGRG